MALRFPSVLIELDLTQQQEPGSVIVLLSLSESDCTGLHLALGDFFNLRFFSHCARSIVGAPGCLSDRRGPLANLETTVESLAADHSSLVFRFHLDKPAEPIENTFIPLTELSKAGFAGSQASDPTSLHTGEAPSQFSDSALQEIGLELGPHADMKFDKQSQPTRQMQMRRDVASRDGSCRLTGGDLLFCDAALLFKACNPDQATCFLWSRPR